MADQDSQSAARLAALIAVPAALLTGVGVFMLLSSSLGEPAGQPGQPTPGVSGPLADPGSPDPGSPGPAGPVATEIRELTEWQETVCRALASQLPGELDGQAQRPVSAGPEQNAAYGDPPAVLACGVPPADYLETDTVFPLPGGVCWHVAEEPDVTVWTTVDREVPVQVTVPGGYDGPGQLVTELSGPIVQTVRSAGTAPSGCAQPR